MSDSKTECSSVVPIFSSKKFSFVPAFSFSSFILQADPEKYYPPSLATGATK